MDLVYIIKKGEINSDLRYSLRSVEKFVPHDKIWIVGYKPFWVTNVKHIPVEQTENKWKNSVKNILAACNCENISDDFVLMNDDFFAIKPIIDLKDSINLSLGSLKDSVDMHKTKNSNWHHAFELVYNLLKELNIPEPYYDYESHTPLLINRKKYLEVMNLPKVKEFMNTSNILHKRTLYKNIEKQYIPITLNQDVKISVDSQVPAKTKVCDWISVADNESRSKFYPQLNNLLQELFPNPSKFETNDFDSNVIPYINSNKNSKYF